MNLPLMIVRKEEKERGRKTKKSPTLKQHLKVLKFVLDKGLGENICKVEVFWQFHCFKTLFGYFVFEVMKFKSNVLGSWFEV